jgi:hypothetical protein
MNPMTNEGMFKAGNSLGKSIAIVLIATGVLLLVPLVAMQFTREVAWTVSDFVVAGMLLSGTGLAYVFAARKLVSPRARLATGIVLATVLLVVWAELAVGIFD